MPEHVQEVIWLTQEAYDKLQHELDELSGPGRAEVTARIAAARDEGDLKENGGYHAAREEQAKIEARIAQLTDLLRNAQIGQAPDDGKVEPGMIVTCTINGTERTFLLGSREAAHGLDIDVYSAHSPLGEALNGRMVGDTASYTAPNGKAFEVKILEVTPFRG